MTDAGWTWNLTPAHEGEPTRVTLSRVGRPATFREVFEGLADDAALGALFTREVAALPYPAVCWETPPLVRPLASPFVCVFVESPALAQVTADSGPFSAKFEAGAPVVVFPSLGRDAWLVAPCPQAADAMYTHLLAFVRTAPPAQVAALWRAVGTLVLGRTSDTPVWLSTAGLGVHWLHVRLDWRPKYYRYRAFADAAWRP